jgi:WD40 repeat protein
MQWRMLLMAGRPVTTCALQLMRSGCGENLSSAIHSVICNRNLWRCVRRAAKEDSASHHPLFVNTLKGHGDVVHGLAWSPSGGSLLTACEDMLVRAWDLSGNIAARDPKFRRIKPPRTPLGAAWAGEGPDATVIVLMRGTPGSLLYSVTSVSLRCRDSW